VEKYRLEISRDNKSETAEMSDERGTIVCSVEKQYMHRIS
jgi:hypothetical protein